ncbi:MAG TPA: hypothetical protein VFJ58_14825 [Armatimonadota bacterium]|nr:hypothetical protein [Armatimonadota bacterium]
MNPRVRRFALAAVVLPLFLQGCGGGGGGGTPPVPTGPTINPVIASWPAGTTWTYAVTTPAGTGSRTQQVLSTGLTNPNDQQPVLEFKDTSDIGSAGTAVISDYYFRQDSTHSVILEGVPQTSTPLWVVSSTPGPAVLLPSPMATGQQIASTVTFSDSSTNTISKSVDTEETIFAPIGAGGASEGILTFRISSVINRGGVNILEQDWFSPTLGIVRIETTDGTNTTTSLLTSTTLPH